MIDNKSCNKTHCYPPVDRQDTAWRSRHVQQRPVFLTVSADKSMYLFVYTTNVHTGGSEFPWLKDIRLMIAYGMKLTEILNSP